MVEVVVVTHPEVTVDPGVPVPLWGLSDAGRDRLARLLDQDWVPGIRRICASTERKAVETAAALAVRTGLRVQQDALLGENDRSATGYLPPVEFEALADAFFARPDDSVRGWEPAHAAQRRVVAAVDRVVADAPGNVAVVTHGGVGTLLLCHLLGVPVDRRHDQPGQGSVFRYDASSGTVLHPWRRIP